MRYWLMKTEPTTFSIDDLAASPKQTTMWDGVRNYQARNFMCDGMQIGDPILFYHSVIDPGITGLAEVVSKSYPDPTQWNVNDGHYDPNSSKDNPRWFLVDVKLVRKFKTPLSLSLLREQKALASMELLRKGSRLSVQPVTKREYDAIVALEKKV